MSHYTEGVAKARRATSAGGVVLSGSSGDYDIVLISPIRRRVWCLPKGTVEIGETFAETAVREVFEETGLRASVVAELSSISYSFLSAKRYPVEKTVHFFLMRTNEECLRWPPAEVFEARWFPLVEAPQVLAYEGERSVVLAAIDKVTREHGLFDVERAESGDTESSERVPRKDE
ncbi:MAG: NUDIX hydrolase [Chloroflexi bacterium]|nr:NUDIX hydrolase [Chloroflexota bacterium]